MLGEPVIGRRRLLRLRLLPPRLDRWQGMVRRSPEAVRRWPGTVRRLLGTVRRWPEAVRRWPGAGQDAAGATAVRRRGSNRSPRRPVTGALPDLRLGVVQVRFRLRDGGRVRIPRNTGCGHSQEIPVPRPGRPRISTAFRTRSLRIRLVAPARSMPLASLVAPPRSVTLASLVIRARSVTLASLVTLARVALARVALTRSVTPARSAAPARLAMRASSAVQHSSAIRASSAVRRSLAVPGTPRCRIPGGFRMMTASRTPTRSPRPRTLVRHSASWRRCRPRHEVRSLDDCPLSPDASHMRLSV